MSMGLRVFAAALLFWPCLGLADDVPSEVLKRYTNFEEFDKAFNDLLKQESYEEAARIVEINGHLHHADYYLYRGYFIYTERIRGSRCEAVRDFEQSLQLGNRFVLGYLNYYYNGDWVAIAAIEGQALALSMLAERYEQQYLTGAPSGSSPRVLRKIYKLYSLAYERGAKDVKKQLKETESRMRAQGVKTAEISFPLKAVFCPVRK